MHLIIACAASEHLPPEALKALQLPVLQSLWPHMQRQTEWRRNDDAPWAGAPFEQAWAALLSPPSSNPSSPSPMHPWAAWLHRHSGHNPTQAMARLSPCHRQIGLDSALLHPPEALQLSASDSQALMDAAQDLLMAEGIHLNWQTPGQWLAEGAAFEHLPSTALETRLGQRLRLSRTSDGHSASWHPEQMQALQNWTRIEVELEMLWANHPVNDARQERGLAPINAVCVQGAGLASASSASPVVLDERLCAPARQGHGADWQSAWQALDADVLPRWARAAGAAAASTAHPAPATLTLCSEYRAECWAWSSKPNPSPSRGWHWGFRHLTQRLTQRLTCRLTHPTSAADALRALLPPPQAPGA